MTTIYFNHVVVVIPAIDLNCPLVICNRKMESKEVVRSLKIELKYHIF